MFVFGASWWAHGPCAAAARPVEGVIEAATSRAPARRAFDKGQELAARGRCNCAQQRRCLWSCTAAHMAAEAHGQEVRASSPVNSSFFCWHHARRLASLSLSTQYLEDCRAPHPLAILSNPVRLLAVRRLIGAADARVPKARVAEALLHRSTADTKAANPHRCAGAVINQRLRIGFASQFPAVRLKDEARKTPKELEAGHNPPHWTHARTLRLQATFSPN